MQKKNTTNKSKIVHPINKDERISANWFKAQDFS